MIDSAARHFLTFAVGVSILEIIFGDWLSAGNLNKLNLIRDKVFHFDVSDLYSTPQPLIRYSRDRYGLRGSYGEPGRINLLTVGGSTTDQRYIADGETWQDVLADEASKNGKHVVVANAGVDGQSTFGHIKNFDWWFPNIPGLKPRYILFYAGLNDFYIKEDDRHDRLIGAQRRQAPSLWQTIQEKSALLHVMRTIDASYNAIVTLKIGHQKVDFNKEQRTDKPLQQDYSFIQPRLKAYAARLRILIGKVRESGSSPIFVTQPSRQYWVKGERIEGRAATSTYEGHQYNGVDYYYMKKLFDEVLKDVCAEEKVLLIDLAGDGDWEDSDFYDFWHMTPQGARKVGVGLYEELVALDWP